MKKKKLDIYIYVMGYRDGPFPPEEIHLVTFEEASVADALEKAFQDDTLIISVCEPGGVNNHRAEYSLRKIEKKD